MRCWGLRSQAVGARRPTRTRRGERGFTLIELMVAAGYFLLGISAVALFQIAAAKGSASAGDLMMATTLTANQIETIRNTPTATLTALGNQTLYYDRQGNTAASPGFFAVSYTFTIPPGNNQYTSATVTTTWRQSSINPFQHGVTMQTYVGSN